MATDTFPSVVAERCHAQLLTRREGRTPEDVVRRLLAVQAQDGRGMRLAVRSRSRGLSATDVDDALTGRRTLVVSWLNRGTLHLVAVEDYWWLHRLTTPQLVVGNRRRLRQEGVDAAHEAKGVATIAESVAIDGPLTRSQLRERLDRRRIPTAGQALVHLLAAATLAGHVARGPIVGSDQAFVSVSDWLGPRPPELERIEAVARLARRYLAGHGPAGPTDLAKWAGVGLRDARSGFEAIAGELAPCGPDLWTLVGAGAGAGPPELPSPRLLGSFDPILLGWRSRDLVTGPHTKVVTTNGIFRPVGLVAGRAVATWRLSAGTLSIDPLEPVSRADQRALRADGYDVGRFLERSVDVVVT
jgi:hypothetical protein